MTAKELKSILMDVDDESEVLIELHGNPTDICNASITKKFNGINSEHDCDSAEYTVDLMLSPRKRTLKSIIRTRRI